jgi:hypothetical protein
VSDLFPLDFEALKKGDVIEQSRIESIYQVKFGTDPTRYRLMQMKLVEIIERERPDLYPRTDRATVRIMEDKEAEAYNCGRHEAHVRGLARDARRRGRINRSEFSDADRRAAESRDLGFAALAAMAKRELVKAEREALMLGPKEEETEEE